MVIDWICCCLVGVDQCGPAATWKLHSDAQKIYKRRNQVVFSVQPIGLPLFHFTHAAIKGKKRELKKNQQWAKDSCYLIFPFLIFQGKEDVSSYLKAIPNHIFSDLIRLGHDGLHFELHPEKVGGTWKNHEYLPKCNEGNLKWIGGILFECKSGDQKKWRGGHYSQNKRKFSSLTSSQTYHGGQHGGFQEGKWKVVGGILSGNQGDFNEDLNSKIKNVDPKDSILLLDAAGVSLMYHYACGWQIHTPPPILGDEEDPTTSPKESFSSTQSCKPSTKKNVTAVSL